MVALLAVAFSDAKARGARLWMAGLVIQTVAVLLFAERHEMSFSLSVVAGNVFFSLSMVLYWGSFDVFFGNRRPHWAYGLPLVLTAVLAGSLLAETRGRTLLLACVFALQNGQIAGTILERRGEFRHRIIFMLAAGYLLAGLSVLVRAGRLLAYAVPAPDPFTPGLAQDVALLLNLPSLFACTLGFVLLHRERMEGEVRRLADLDPLTGLRNRRGFAALFARELRAAATSRQWTSLALIDIDHFKAVNDRHGHAMGDVALVALSRILAQELRSGDNIARIGGDEFCILLPGADRRQAAGVAERLRQAVSVYDWRAMGLLKPLTVTIGLASHLVDQDEDGADFLELADMALLAAKDMARNMVLHADQLVSVHPVRVRT